MYVVYTHIYFLLLFVPRPRLGNETNKMWCRCCWSRFLIFFSCCLILYYFSAVTMYWWDKPNVLCCHVATVTQSTLYVVYSIIHIDCHIIVLRPWHPFLYWLLLLFRLYFKWNEHWVFVRKMINIPTNTNTHKTLYNPSNPNSRAKYKIKKRSKIKCSNSTESIYIITIANISREKQHSTHTPTLTLCLLFCFGIEQSHLGDGIEVWGQ